MCTVHHKSKNITKLGKVQKGAHHKNINKSRYKHFKFQSKHQISETLVECLANSNNSLRVFLFCICMAFFVFALLVIECCFFGPYSWLLLAICFCLSCYAGVGLLSQSQLLTYSIHKFVLHIHYAPVKWIPVL